MHAQIRARGDQFGLEIANAVIYVHVAFDKYENI